MDADPTPIKRARSAWSRTALVGLAGIAGATVIGVAALVTGHADGATLGAVVACISGCVGAVAGRGGQSGAEP
jgi:hypothetical protein